MHQVSLPGGPPLNESLNPANQFCPKVELISDKITAGQSPSFPFIFCCPNINLLSNKDLNDLTNIVSVSTYIPPYCKSICNLITSLL